MKKIIIDTCKAVKSKIQPQKHTFELLGYDFILDEKLNTILIEVNTNPCLEESNNLLKKILPRMVDDLFNIVLDPIFTPGQSEKYRSKFKLTPEIFSTKVVTKESDSNGDESTKNSSNNFEEKEPHPGYKDDENLWRHILTLDLWWNEETKTRFWNG